MINAEQLAAFDSVSAEVFGHPKGQAYSFLEAALASSKIDIILGQVNGEPVATGVACYLDGMAYLCWGAVLAEYRRQGIASSLVNYRLSLAKDRDCAAVYSQNMPTSAGYFQKIGFKPIGNLSLFSCDI